MALSAYGRNLGLLAAVPHLALAAVLEGLDLEDLAYTLEARASLGSPQLAPDLLESPYRLLDVIPALTLSQSQLTAFGY